MASGSNLLATFGYASGEGATAKDCFGLARRRRGTHLVLGCCRRTAELAKPARTVHVEVAAPSGKGTSGAMLAKDRHTNTQAWPWMLSAFFAAILSAGLAVAILGTNKTGTTAAIKVSALLSFLLFLAAYVGSPLAILFGSLFDGLARRGRELGLAFATTLSVHLGLVALTIARSSHPFVPNRLEIAEIIGAIWIYALAVFSIARLRSILSPAFWRWMRILGMDYIALIFARNFVSFPLKPLYLPFLLAAIGAIVLRIAATIRRRSNTIDGDLSHGGKLRVG